MLLPVDENYKLVYKYEKALICPKMTSISTFIYTLFKGVLVGTDELGNKYYESRRPCREFGRKNRWVIYNGITEASKVSAHWFAWLHYTSNAIPESKPKKLAWQKDHQPNLTGTKQAYYPKGHALAGAKRDHSTGDYQAWRPKQQ